MNESSKRSKCFSIIPVCLLLAAAILAGSTIPVEAPAPEKIIMWAVINSNPGPGYYGGYHDMLYSIQDTLNDTLDIDLRIEMFDGWEWYDIVWEQQWNIPGNAPGSDPTTYTPYTDGWDFSLCEWWLNPTNYIWMDELAYSWATPTTGYNIMSWTNYKTDYLWQKAQTTPPSDPTTHKRYMWLWQEEFMHNPPVIPIYYADHMTARAAYVDGFDEVAWVYGIKALDINETTFNTVVSPTDPRYSYGSNTVIWAAAEDILYPFPLGCNTYTEEQVNVLKQGTLYNMIREDMTFPTSGRYIDQPCLATAPPTWSQQPDGKWVATVRIVSGLTWTDGVPFNATDVAFSYKSIITENIKSYAYQDYSIMLEDVQVVNATAVKFIYKAGMGPDYDFMGYNAHGWAVAMLPWHQLKNEPLRNWKSGTDYGWNKDYIPDSADGQLGFTGPNRGVECLGPYKPIEWDSANKQWVKFQKRPEYISALGWPNNLPEYYLLKIIGEDTARLSALQTLAADIIEYPIASTTTWELMETWPTHKVYSFHYPASHPLWMNLKNPILSNRYVRLAIAHAIDYPYIFNEVLPGWGVSQAYPGKTFILPWHEAFDTDLGNYEYDPVKARAYMDMWRYSQANKQPYTSGPVGDHDFSGYVETADFPTWAKWWNTHSADWTFPPSMDIDPDNDNNDYVESIDYGLWGEKFGNHYPFYGAW